MKIAEIYTIVLNDGYLYINGVKVGILGSIGHSLDAFYWKSVLEHLMPAYKNISLMKSTQYMIVYSVIV